MMGHPYSYPIDMWSLACTLFELWTGSILFQGKSNNEMLKVRFVVVIFLSSVFQQIFSLKGKPSTKWVKRGAFKDQHFTEDMKFRFREVDKVTNMVSFLTRG